MIKHFLKLIWINLKQNLNLLSIRRANPSCVFHNGAQLVGSNQIGNHVVLFNDVTIVSSNIGRNTYIQKKSVIVNAEIGPFCSIADEVSVGLANHPTHFMSTHPAFYDNQQPLPYFLVDKQLYNQSIPLTTIGADVWIGQGAKIKAGINIGAGSVIAAGSVVTKDIAPYSIVGGVPAKLLKMRFEDSLVQELLKSKWWELSNEELKKISSHFAHPQSFLQTMKGKTNA